ncbi:MAG: PQQ-dependent sugar dehydrogenase [Sphingomonadaceae bacterium]
MSRIPPPPLIPALIALFVVMAAAPAAGGAAPQQQVQDPRFFQETGFRIDNDAFFDYFTHRGGVRTFGFPVSRSFVLEGFAVQVFQRGVMQQGGDGGVRLLNLLDPGLLAVTAINGSQFPAPDAGLVQSTPVEGQPDYDRAIIEFTRANAPDQFEGLDVGFMRTFESTVGLADAFPQGGGNPDLLPLLNLEIWGAPTSRPAFDPNNRNFVYQRFQRGIMHFDATTGLTQGLLLGDWFKGVLTGTGLPADLEAQLAGSPFLRQYNNTQPRGLNRLDQLPSSDLQNAFEPQQPVAPQSFQPRVEVVASGLNTPWALAFAPDGRLFFTERPGRIRVIVDGQLLPDPVAVLPAVTTAESGLMGLALDPNFAQNGQIYVMYTREAGPGQLANRLSRLTVQGNQAGGETVLLDGIPAATIHDGGRLRFGPDGKLYVTTGDAAASSLAQDIGSVAGKVLRINPDGTIPEDNPFPGSPVFTFGHRNPQGLAFQPGTGQLFSTEHGPSGNDEVNVLQAGGNYGWPGVQGAAGDSRFIDPILVFNPAVAPAGATFYDADRLFEWTGSLFFATLRGGHLHRVVLGGPDSRQVVAQERLFEGDFGRLREVTQGPDGLIYFTTSNRDGRGNPAAEDDRILRITLD